MALMEYPFTQQQFLNVFAQYNLAVFPLQVLFYVLGIAALVFALKKTAGSARIIALILGFFWFWMGLVYHIGFFRAINPAATLFGIMFIVQAALLLYCGVVKNQLGFGFSRDRYTFVSLVLVVYAMAIYPVIGIWAGQSYPQLPTFGLPCPTTIFTFGIFLLADRKFPHVLLVIPVIWSFIGFFAALSFGVTEDYALIVAGIAATALIVMKNRRTPEP